MVVWYSYFIKNISQFVVIHKGFSIVSEAAQIIFFLNCLAFYDPEYVGNLISGCSAFSKSSLNICKFLAKLLLKPRLKDFEHFLASMK